MSTSNIIIKAKPKVLKFQNGKSSDLNANNFGLNQKTWRFTDWVSQHEGLQPAVAPPSLLPREYFVKNNQQPPINKVGIDNLSAGLSKSLSTGLSTSLAGGPQQGGEGKGMAGGAASAITDTIGMGLSGAGALVSMFRKDDPLNTWGIASPTDKGKKSDITASALGGAGAGVSMGAKLGSAAGPWGTAIGGALGGIAGGVIGLLKGKKKVKSEEKEYKDSTQMAYESYNQKANAQQYAAMGRVGTKLVVMNKIKDSKKNAVSYKNRKFKVGGKLDRVGEVNVIPSGTLHKENNNLGQKDKGIPIIDENGKKIFEVEREELILRLKTTKSVEELVDKYKKSNNDRHLVELGKLLSKEIMTNTHDLSGKYGLEAK